ncbi:MAG: DUF721 domain-containing protein [Flavobacteriaceae bacterium]|nr:DUF721 domain-containing protein [Flavobacteriaceae bacterium]PHS09455.1 MAG: RNA-binding protein [Kordia sp.]
MAKRNKENMSIADVLKGFIKENNLDKGLDKIDAQNAWYAVMGKSIEAYTDSVELKNQTLVVRLSSAPLREELSYGRSKIIVNMNEFLRRDIIKELILA